MFSVQEEKAKDTLVRFVFEKVKHMQIQKAVRGFYKQLEKVQERVRLSRQLNAGLERDIIERMDKTVEYVNERIQEYKPLRTLAKPLLRELQKLEPQNKKAAAR
jgi:hypothetical protein